jgi:altronate hydrolase
VKSNAIKVNAEDNVAVASQIIPSGGAVIVDGQQQTAATQEIPLGHKVALSAMTTGQPVIRYGEPIVEATEAIAIGNHVHVHNTRPIPGGE